MYPIYIFLIYLNIVMAQRVLSEWASKRYLPPAYITILKYKRKSLQVSKTQV